VKGLAVLHKVGTSPLFDLPSKIAPYIAPVKCVSFCSLVSVQRIKVPWAWIRLLGAPLLQDHGVVDLDWVLP